MTARARPPRRASGPGNPAGNDPAGAAPTPAAGRPGADGPIGRTALMAMAAVYRGLGEDPSLTFVALMTSAAIAGHMIERSPEEMHRALDQVRDVAEAIMLGVTEPLQ